MSDQTVSLELRGDATELKKALDSSAKGMDDLSGSGRKMGDDLDRVMSGIVDSGGAVDQTIRGIDQRLGTLTGADREVFLRANTTQAEGALREIDRMLTDPKLTDAEITLTLDRRNQVSAQIDKMKDELGELEQAVQDVGEEGKRSFGALAGAIGSAGAASRIDEAVTSTGRLRAQLGLTADEAREFDAIAKTVYADNFGDSMGEAAQVTGHVHQALRLVGGELESATTGVFSIRDAFDHLGADVDTTLNATRTLSANFEGLDPEGALDLIARGFQSGAGSAGDLLDVLQEYPGDFARIGLDAEDMVGILNAGLDSGAWNADRVGDAVRELGIRISTAGDAGQEAMHDLFPESEANRLIGDFNRGGEAGREAFFSIIDAIAQTEDPNERYNAQVAIMGTLGEELANQFPEFADAIRDVGDGATAAGTGVEGLAAQYDGFRNTLEGFMRSIETSVIGTLGDVGLGFADVGANVGIAALGMKGMVDLFPGLGSGLRGVTGSLGSLAKGAGAFAIAGIAVQQTISAWGDAMADAQSDAEDFVDSFTSNSIRPVDSMGELHDEIMRVGSAAAEMKRRGDEALNPFLKERFREAEAGLVVTRDGLLEAEAAAGQFQRELGISADEAARMATNNAVMGAAVDEATGELDSGAAVRQQTAEEFEAMEASIRGVNDALHAQFDPLFAAQDALLANADAQEDVRRAELELLRAQKDLNDAVAAHGPKSDEATQASMDLLGAQDRLTRANRDATRSAMDVSTATNELAMKMRDSGLDIAGAEAQLRAWVDQGLITEQQAWDTAQELRGVATRAGELEGKNIQIPVGLTGYEAVIYRLDELARRAGTPLIFNASIRARESAAVDRASGGIVPGTLGQMVPVNAHGMEYVIRAEAAQAIGYDTLDRLNRADQMPAMSAGAFAAPMMAGSSGPGFVDNSRTEIVVRDPREAMSEIRAAHRMKQLSYS